MRNPLLSPNPSDGFAHVSAYRRREKLEPLNIAVRIDSVSARKAGLPTGGL